MKGQALIEFIIFLPIFFMLMLIMVVIVAAINGSINQQKAVRGYFYSLAKQNSFVPNRADLDVFLAQGRNYVGMQVLGWKEKFINGEVPLATCYKSGGALVAKEAVDSCENPARSGQKTSFIRPFTVYGICSNNYSRQNGKMVYDFLAGGSSIASRCSMQ